MNATTTPANATTINGKEVDLSTIGIDGVDRKDYPDFCDAFISSARFTDGIELDDAELEQLTEENYDLINQLVIENLY